MQRIPLSARVECADGPCGELTGLVVRADSRALEYYVVRDTTPGHAIERLVPRARVDPAGMSVVHLDCTNAELAKMQPLNVQEYQHTGPPKHGASAPMGLVDSERAPDGTGVLRQDLRVEASNGTIGKLNGVVIDEQARITHFYTRLDRRDAPELFLPATAVYYVDRWTVYLRLDKHQVESLPSLPSLTGESGEPAHKHMELVACVYDTPTGASAALDQLRQVQQDAAHPLSIRESAVLVREGDAAPRVDTSGPKGTRKGAAMGAAAGGLLAVLGPIGIVAGAVAGGAVGGLVGSRIQLGFPDAFLHRLQERLKPDHSALVVLLEHDPDQDPEQVRRVLEGAMSQAALVDSLVQEMLATEQTPIAAATN